MKQCEICGEIKANSKFYKKRPECKVCLDTIIKEGSQNKCNRTIDTVLKEIQQQDSRYYHKMVNANNGKRYLEIELIKNKISYRPCSQGFLIFGTIILTQNYKWKNKGHNKWYQCQNIKHLKSILNK